MSALDFREQGKIYQVNDFMIDTNLREISRGCEAYKPPAHIFDTVVYLIENRDRAVSLNEFKKDVWKDAKIDEFQFLRNITLARRAILDDTEKRLIRYASDKNAFQFCGDVFEVEFR